MNRFRSCVRRCKEKKSELWKCFGFSGGYSRIKCRLLGYTVQRTDLHDSCPYVIVDELDVNHSAPTYSDKHNDVYTLYYKFSWLDRALETVEPVTTEVTAVANMFISEDVDRRLAKGEISVVRR